MIIKNNISLPTGMLDASFNRAARKSLLALFRQAPTHREDKPKTKRTSLNCGWDYTKLKAGEKIWVEPAPIVTELYWTLKSSLEACNPGLTLPETFGNAIISRYGPKDRLQPHIDLNRDLAIKKGLKGYFGDRILGAVIEADPKGHLFLEHPDGPAHLPESDGFCFCLEQEARHSLPHGITETASSRLSVTYRTVEFV